MGASSSKQDAAPKTQVWSSETPVRFSQGLVDSLSGSTETDSTRAKTLELHIQARVAEELKALQERAAKEYADLSSKISSPSSPPENKDKKSAGDQLREMGREAVQSDVADLRKKLEQRKKIKETDAEVEKAKEGLVKCLRENDRRPLDCWREVEGFKREVRRLEGEWVERVVR